MYTTQDFLQEVQGKGGLMQLCSITPADVPVLWRAFGAAVQAAVFGTPALSVTVKDWICFVAPGTARFAPAFLKGNGLRARQQRVLSLDHRLPTPARSLPTLYRDVASAIGASGHNVECCIRHMAAAIGEAMRDPRERRVAIDVDGVGTFHAHRGVVEFVWDGDTVSERAPTPMGRSPHPLARAATPTTMNPPPLPERYQSTPSKSLPPRAVTPISMSMPRPGTPADAAASYMRQLEPLPLRPYTPQGQAPCSGSLPAMSQSPQHPYHDHVHFNAGLSGSSLTPTEIRSKMATTSLSLSQPIYATPSTFKTANQFSVDVVMDLAMSRHGVELERARRVRETEARNAVLEQELHRRMLALEKKRKVKAQQMTQAVLNDQMAEQKNRNAPTKGLVEELLMEKAMLPEKEGTDRERVRAEQSKLRCVLDQQVSQRRDEITSRKVRARDQENEALRKVRDEIESEKLDVRGRLMHMQKVLAAAWEAQIQLEHSKKT